MNKQVIFSYARTLLATVLTIIFAVGKFPTEFTAQDWYGVLNALWISIIPVAIRWFDPKDTAFGVAKNDTTSGN